jgi:hypothetical protein
MISMKMDVITSEGTSTVSITPKVQVEFERHHSMGIAKAFGEDMRMEHVYWLAWKSMRHVKSTSLDFDQWLDTVIDVEMEGDDTPLEPAR